MPLILEFYIQMGMRNNEMPFIQESLGQMGCEFDKLTNKQTKWLQQ